MTRSRLRWPAALALAFAVSACVAPDGGAAVRVETADPAPLTSLPAAATTTSSTTTTTTLAIPAPPDIGDGTVCDLYSDTVEELGTVANEAIKEASGIAASLINDAFWVVNDSGNDDVLFAVGPRGADLAAIPIEGVLGFDWEDIAVGPGPDPALSYVYIGDIGDNLRLRTTISLLRFPEPDLTNPPAVITDVTTIRLTYPEAVADSEAMWVDPITGDIFVVTKGQADGRTVVYRAPAVDSGGPESRPLEPVAEFVFGDNVSVTAADVTTDGAVLALRGYNQVWMWLRTDLGYRDTLAAEPCLAPSPDEVQGESLGFRPGELTYVTVSEGSAKPLNQVAATD